MAVGSMTLSMYDLLKTLLPASLTLGYPMAYMSPGALAGRGTGAYVSGGRGMGAYVSGGQPASARIANPATARVIPMSRIASERSRYVR